MRLASEIVAGGPLAGQERRRRHRQGCRADALNIYRAGHRIMIAEVGLEPGPQLRSLGQVLRATPAQLARGLVSVPAPERH